MDNPLNSTTPTSDEVPTTTATNVSACPTYEKYDVGEMDDNPLICALRRPTDDEGEQIDRLALKPIFSEAERDLPASIRILLLNRLRENFFFPTDSHIKIYKDTEAQVFGGYWSRNPLLALGQRLVHNAGKEGRQIEVPSGSQSGLGASISFWVGVPGQGKTSLVRAVGRALGKPVIHHSLFNGYVLSETQIVTLMRNFTDQPNCTAKAIAKLLGDRADELLGIQKYGQLFNDKSMTRTHYVSELRKIVSTNWVGALVLDVFENISLLGSKGEKELVAMLVNLRDELGIPLILIGTYKAAEILDTASASVTRRFVDGGMHDLKRPLSFEDEEFRAFCEVLWSYQWVRKPVELDEPMYSVLYDLTQGITAILLMLWRYAQTEAIRSKEEVVTEKLLKDVYLDRLRPLHRILEALKSGEMPLLNKFDDLYLRAFREIESSEAATRLTEIMNKAKQPNAGGEDRSSKHSNPRPHTSAAAVMSCADRSAEVLSHTAGLPNELR